MKKRICGTQLNMFELAEPVHDKAASKGQIHAMVKIRKLKIQYGQYQGSHRRHPVIRLAGQWLSKLDFKIGDSVLIETVKGHLHISKSFAEN